MPADRDALLALAERVEKAEGPDRELDAKVALAAGWVCENDAWWWPPHIVAMARRKKRGKWMWRTQSIPMPPTYTASIDAALTLVPEGWKWTVYSTQRPPYQDCGLADLYAPGEGHNPADVVDIYASTPALALTAAALRARAEGGV